MSPRNGRNRPQRPRIELAATTSATIEEAAAIAAAIEGFLRDTAPAPAPPAGPSVSRWARVAAFESAGLPSDGPSPWGDPQPWGR
ncbi:MAG TPA: hypothetical protein VK387_08375 [Thermoleophilaceae bacterium]|nr:hypothetical protein [Thermoleophilaceae bacterium]